MRFSSGRHRATRRPRPGVAVVIVASLVLGWGFSVPRVSAHAPPSEQAAQLTRAEAAHPNDPDLLLQRSSLERQAGHADAAAAAAQRALALGAPRAAATAALAEALLIGDMPGLAHAMIDAALLEDANAPELLWLRGTTRQTQGDSAGAAADFIKVLEISTQPEPARVLQAMAACGTAHRPEEALRAAELARLKLGLVATVELAAVDLEQATGRHAAALERIDLLLTQSPQHPDWLARRADVLDDLGRRTEARQVRQTALTALAARPSERRGKRLAALESKLRADVKFLDAPGAGEP